MIVQGGLVFYDQAYTNNLEIAFQARMGKLRTKDYILAVSLDFLNQHGEASVTAVDLANELDISPGNLYYHFKGKSEIIKTLLERYTRAFEAAFPVRDVARRTPIENWMSLYVLMEQVYLYRFLFRNPAGILESYPEISKPLGNLYLQLHNYIAAVLETVVDGQGEGAIVPTDMVVLILTNWFNYRDIVIPRGDKTQLIKSGMSRLEQLLQPHCPEQMAAAMKICNAQY